MDLSKHKKYNKIKKFKHKNGDPCAIRTRDTLIKSQVLCRLS